MKQYLRITGLSILLWSLGHPAWAYTKTINVSIDDNCIELRFEQGASEVFSCKYPKSISYVKKDCSSNKSLEKGTVDALLSCPGEDHWELKFRTSKSIVTLLLDVQRESKGLDGLVANYRVHSSQFQPLKDELPAPKIIFKADQSKNKGEQK